MIYRKFLIAAVSLLLFACGGNDPQEQKQFLTGYWQIENVDSPYGEDKTYEINERVDYIEVENDSGFRAKVIPRLDGSIITNGNTERIGFEIKDDSLRLHYKTDYDTWTETVLEASQNHLKVKNDRGMIYTYSRYEPINLAADGLLEEGE